MKIERLKISGYFGAIVIVIANLAAEGFTLKINPDFSGIVNLLKFIDFGGVSVLIPLFLLLQSNLCVECTSTRTLESGRGIAFSAKPDGTKTSSTRQPRIIKELTMLNRQSCLSKILCGVDIAKPPSSSSSTINDYAYLVKSFFDQFSIQGGLKNALELDDVNSDEEEEDEETSSNSFRMQNNKRKNSRRPFVPYEEAMDVFGDEEIDKMYAQPLEELLEERDSLLGFKRRRSRQNQNLTSDEGTQIKITIICHSKNSTDCSSNKESVKRSGFMGYNNPRFDKTAFLDQKQQQLQNATNDEEKLRIAGIVAARLRSPRQCRLLNWFRPKYTTTTTITTTSDDPSIVQSTNGAAVNSMCPFTVQELQKMILDSQSTTKSATASGQLAQMAIKNGIQQIPGIQGQVTPTQSTPLARPTPYKIQRPITKKQPTFASQPAFSAGPMSYDAGPPPARPPPKTTPRPQTQVVDDEKEIQPFPNIAGTSPYSKPKYKPKYRHGIQDDEQIDVLGNPQADLLAQNYHYKPLPQTTEHPTLGAPYWSEVINQQLPIYPFGKPNPNGKKTRPGKVPIDFKLKPDESNKNEETEDDDESNENSPEKSEEDEEDNDNNEKRDLPNQEEHSDEHDQKDDESKEEEHSDKNDESKETDSNGPIERPSNGPSHKHSRPPPPPDKHYYNPLPPTKQKRPSIFSMAMDKLSLNKHRLVLDAPLSSSPNLRPQMVSENGSQMGPAKSQDKLPLQDLIDEESEESSEDPIDHPKREANKFEEDKPVSLRESEEFGAVPGNQPQNNQNNQDQSEKDPSDDAADDDDSDEEADDDKNDKNDDESKEEENSDKNHPTRPNTPAPNDLKNVAKIIHERDPNDESEEEQAKIQQANQKNEENSEEDEDKSPNKNKPSNYSNDESEEETKEGKKNSKLNPNSNYNYYDEEKVSQQDGPQKEETFSNINEKEESQEDEEEDDEEDEDKAEVVHRRPPHQIPIPKFTKSKTTPKPVTNKDEKTSNSTSSGGATGYFKKFLHGSRTISSIANWINSKKESNPEEGCAGCINKPEPPQGGPPPGRPPKRRRTKRPERPYNDQGSDSNEEDDDDDEEDEEEEDEENKRKKKKSKPSSPPPRPLPPVQLPPRIVAVPIYLEGKATWEGQEKPNEEEFFEDTKKHSSKKKKAEKYDYDDDIGSEESNKSSQETSNTSEGVDFGPGQNIHTEYSDVVQGYLNPGTRLVNNDRYVSGLPTSWEEIYQDIKNKEKKKTSSSSASEEIQNDDNSEESEEDDRRGPPPRSKRPPRPPPPRHHHHYALEPID